MTRKLAACALFFALFAIGVLQTKPEEDVSKNKDKSPVNGNTFKSHLLFYCFHDTMNCKLRFRMSPRMKLFVSKRIPCIANEYAKLCLSSFDIKCELIALIGLVVPILKDLFLFSILFQILNFF